MSATERTFPTPAINVETEQFWQAAGEGVLLLKRCNGCGETHYYPRAICPFCQSDDTEWYPASGEGKIYSFSVMRRAQVPFVIAYVTLPEGITMMSNIVDCDPDSVHIGQSVKVSFKASEEGQAVPVFAPA